MQIRLKSLEDAQQVQVRSHSFFNIHVRAGVCSRVYTSTHACTHEPTHVRSRAFVRIHPYTRMHARTHTCQIEAIQEELEECFVETNAKLRAEISELKNER